MRWNNKLSWLIFGAISIFLGWFVLFGAKVQQAGDIAEYFGTTESLINHGSVSLSGDDRSRLEQILHPAYFEMPGYYIKGRDLQRFPVHFWFYSVLAVPIRLLLSLFEFDSIRSLLVVNWLSIVFSVGIVMGRYLKDEFKRIALLIMVFTGAMMSFLVWPGPDLWYLSLLLIVPFAFFNKEYWLAAILAAVASWHSQPLMILAAGLIGYAGLHPLLTTHKKWFSLVGKQILWAGMIGLIMLLPYGYNLFAFGVLTPWMQLRDGWTVMNGFGAQNMSLWKFYEQWFDLNVGLFWYAPELFILGLLGIWKVSGKKIELWLFLGLLILTGFFYQTNPAWHYGTVGFGPGRHGVFLLPILMYFALQMFRTRMVGIILAALLGVSQLWGLSLNGYLEPDFTKSLSLSPYAEYVLARWPKLYNPTPEIFVDRVNHSDVDYPTSAIYMVDGRCIKAYVLVTEKDQLMTACGGIPAEYMNKFDDKFKRVANYDRRVITNEATFWPYGPMCDKSFQLTEQQPFVCGDNRANMTKLIGLDDESRLSVVPNFEYPGIWKVIKGDPVELTVPAGYVLDYYALEGVYVNF